MFGVRGVAKSTWAREHFPEAPRIDLLDEGRYRALRVDPSLFGYEMRAVLNEVHRQIEERSLRFVPLGSSARKLRVAGTNLLAGRALWKTMFPLLPAELGADFALARVLRYGSIPLIWNARQPRQTLEAYVQLYLRDEIKAEALVRNLPGFVRFLPIAAMFHGQTINVAGIAGDAGTETARPAGSSIEIIRVIHAKRDTQFSSGG